GEGDADHRVAGADRRDHHHRAELEGAVVHEVRTGGHDAVDDKDPDDAAEAFETLATDEQDHRRRECAEHRRDDHGREAADAPAAHRCAEVGATPAESGEQAPDHSGRASARASTATAPRAPTKSGLASSEVMRARRSWAA